MNHVSGKPSLGKVTAASGGLFVILRPTLAKLALMQLLQLAWPSAFEFLFKLIQGQADQSRIHAALLQFVANGQGSVATVLTHAGIGRCKALVTLQTALGQIIQHRVQLGGGEAGRELALQFRPAVLPGGEQARCRGLYF